MTFLTALIFVEGHRSSKSLAYIGAAEKWTNDSNPVFLDLKPVESGGNTRNGSDLKANPLANKLEYFNSISELRHIISTQRFHYLFARAPEGRLGEGFLFKVEVSNTKMTIWRTGEGKT